MSHRTGTPELPRPSQPELKASNGRGMLWPDVESEDASLKLALDSPDEDGAGNDGRASYRRLKAEQEALIGLMRSPKARELRKRRLEAQLPGGVLNPEMVKIVRSEVNRRLIRREYEIRLSHGHPADSPAS